MKKRIVTLLGDATHNHDILLDGLSKIVTEKMERYVIRDIASDSFVEALDGNPEVVIISKMNPYKLDDGTSANWLTPEKEDKLVGYVDAGGSLVVWHSGLAAFPADGKYIQMLGGRFYHRPPDFLPVKYMTVAKTPMTEEAMEFEQLDEHYLIDCDMEKSSIFMHSESSEGATPAGWYRTFGKGKVCCIAAPHPSLDIQIPELEDVLYKCLVWSTEV
jgi:type 1 glutamine amidotransferase